MNDNLWLQNLKAGEKVILKFSGWGNARREICEVSHLTKNFIVVKGYKFRKESGWATGDSYHPPILYQLSPELLTEVEEETYRRVFQNKLNNLSWSDVPLDVVKQVRELVEPYVKRKDNK